MGTGAKVGTAYVDIEGDFTPLERQLQALRAPFVAKGKEFGKSLSAGMTPALAQVSKELLDVGGSGEIAERRVGKSFKGIAKSIADSARKIGDSVKVAGQESRALGRDITDSAAAVDTAFGKATGATGEFHESLRVTKAATSHLASAFGGLVDDTDDYVVGLARAHGITVQSSSSVQQLRDHNLSLADTFGGLVGESGDFADELRRVGAEQSRATATAVGADKAHGRFGQTLQRIGVRIRGAGTGLRTLGDESDGADRSLGRFNRSVGAAGGGIGGLLSGLGGLGGGFGALGGAVAVGIPLLIGFGGATFALGAALAPVAGLAAAAAVGLTAAAQGAGVFALATAGIGAAIKEQLTAHGQAAGAATDSAVAQRAAARAIQAAEDGVADAKDRVRQAGVALAASHRGELAATDALTEAEHDARAAVQGLSDARAQARRSIEDLTSAVADGAVSEAQATATLRDARRALADLEAGASADDLADAHNRVTDAVLGETRATQALEDAHKALADLLAGPSADDTADAHEKLTDAQRAQEHAVLALKKAQADAQAILESSTATDDEKAQARLDLADAEDRVGDATTASARAQKDLTDLEKGADPKKVERARTDVAEAEQRVVEARENSSRAQKDLAKTEAAADPEALEDARVAVTAAENALATAIRDHTRDQEALTKAEKDGVKNAPEVVAARQALADANKRVKDAEQGVLDAHRDAETADKALTRARRDVTRATRDLSDAQANAAAGTAAATSGAQDLNKAFNDLPPAAQAFVRQIIALKPKLDELRATAAQGLFPGVSAGLEAALKNFEPVKRIVGETAGVFGGLAQKAGELIGSKGFGQDLETIGHRNSIVIGRLGDAAIHLGSALRHIIVAAGPLTTWLAKVIDGWARSADEAARAGRESGGLAKFFDKTKSVLKQVGSIVGNLATAFYNLGGAAAPSGNGILKSLDSITAKFSKWTGSVKGQDAIRDFFKKTSDFAKDAATGIGSFIAAMTKLSMEVMPALTAAFEVVKPHLKELLAGFIAWKVAATALAIAETAVAVATGLWAAGQWLLNAALNANPIGLIVLAIAALGAGLIYAYKHSETFRSAIGAIGDVVTGAVGLLKDAFGWVKDNWKLLLAILIGPIGLAVLAISKHADDIVAFFKDLPGRIVDMIKAGAEAFASAATWIKDQLVDGIKAFASVIGDVGKWYVDTLIGAIKSYISLLAAVGGWVVDRIVDGVKAVASAVSAAAKWYLDTLVGAVKSYLSVWAAAGSWVLDAIVDGFKVVTELLGTVGGWLKNRVVELVHAAIDGFTSIGSWILNRIVDGFKVVTELLGTVGGWLKNRIEEFAHAAIDGFKGVGGWILNRIVEGVTTVTELLGTVGGWLKNRIKETVELALDGFTAIGGWIMEKIVAGLKGGVNLFVSFVNELIDIINKIPGVEIGHVKKLAVDGKKDVQQHARGGKITSPMAIVGEEAPRHPEYVIPTNPAYRSRAIGLYGQLSKELGIPGFKTGGVLGALGGAVSSVASVPGGLLSGGAKWILDKLPDVKGLPDWIKGLGSYALKKVTGWIKDKVGSIVSAVTGGGGSSVGGYTGPPADEKRLGDAAWVDAHTLAVTAFLDRKFGLTQSSGYRSPEHNAKIGGAPGSHHTRGSAANPGATDSVGPMGAMQGMIAYARQHVAGLVEAMVDNYAGSGYNAHLAFFAKGGIIGDDGGSISAPFVGSYKFGGVVPADGLAYVHEGERITPADGDPADLFQVDVHVDDPTLRDLIRVEIRRRDRDSAAEFRAGVA